MVGPSKGKGAGYSPHELTGHTFRWNRIEVNMDHKFPDGADDYYNVEKASKMLDTPVPEGYTRWRCVLCGFPQGDFRTGVEVGHYCCGGCGQSCCRPISEYGR